LPLKVENEKENATGVVSQQGGAPPHFEVEAGLFLNAGLKDQ
jgi:hypothetical protein